MATVTMNRPQRGNSLTTQLKSALRESLEEISADETIRAVILTGAGSTFCVGQDLNEHAQALLRDPTAAFATIHEHYNPIVTALSTMPKPVIAAINGACVGAGLGFALACDLRVAATSATFATAFTGIGLSCDSGLSVSLARAVGAARASELLLLNEKLTASRAAELGIVGEVVPPEQLPETARTLANRLAAGPTLAYAEIKRALATAWRQPLHDVLNAEAQAQTRLGHTIDHRAAVEAFQKKTTPTFTGQ